MDLSSLLLFIPACFALNMAPGPNNLLSLHNASRYGLRTAGVAGAGAGTTASGVPPCFGAGCVAHVSLAYPTCPRLSAACAAAAIAACSRAG